MSARSRSDRYPKTCRSAARLASAQQHALAAEASPASKVRLDGCPRVVQVEDPVADRVGLRAQPPKQRPVDAVAAISSAALAG